MEIQLCNQLEYFQNTFIYFSYTSDIMKYLVPPQKKYIWFDDAIFMYIKKLIEYE